MDGLFAGAFQGVLVSMIQGGWPARLAIMLLLGCFIQETNHVKVEKVLFPRDPGSPSENGSMEPKYYAFRR